MNLDEAIDQAITLGHSTPLEVNAWIEKTQEPEWLAAELVALSEDVITERARHRLNAARRAMVVAIRPGGSVNKAELGLKLLWVPDFVAPGVSGWKDMNDCTADDLDSAAKYREGAARSILAQAGWLRELSSRMRAQGADTFETYRGELPVLVAADETEAA